MKIPLLDLKAQYQAIRGEIEAPLLKLLEEQMFILGKPVEELEAAVASYSNVKHAIGVSSGTDALILALMALDIGPGDEVITSPYTFFATAGAAHRVGAKPVFVDIDPETFNLRPDLVEKAVSGRTKAIMPVHLYGQCAEMGPILDVATQRNLAVVEDAAQAIGAEYQGRRAGSMGTIGCFSFFPSKNLGAFGDGGMVVTNDPALAEKMRILRVHGAKPKYFHKVVGGNFRLDSIQALVLSIKLRHLDDWTRGRQRVAARYRELFEAAGLVTSGKVKLPQVCQNRHIFNQFIIRTRERDKLKAFLGEHGVATEIYYPVPLHIQECFRHLGYKEGSMPESERAAKETLATPTYSELTEEQQCYVVETIRQFYAGS